MTATAQKLSLSFFGNYQCATGVATGTSPVKNDAGTEITFPDGQVNCHALTHHIRDDILWAAGPSSDDADTLIYQKVAGATAFTLQATITGAGIPHHMIRDGDQQFVLYLATDAGLYKTYDGGTTWVQLRDYSGTGLKGLQVGYGSAALAKVTALTVVSAVGDGKFFQLGTEPDQWQLVGFDDSDWTTSVAQTHGEPETITGTTWIDLDNSAAVAADTERLFRETFDLTGGFISSATLQIMADNVLVQVWINNVSIFQGPGTVMFTPTTITFDPAILINGGTNILAVRFQNKTATTGMGIDFKLAVS